MRRLTILTLLLLGTLVGHAHAQNLATVMPVPRIQFLDNTGVPLSGGFLYTYSAGTTTPQQACATASVVNTTTCTTPLPNPITLDSAGRPQTGGSVETAIYLLPQNYKFVLQNSSAVTVYTQDNISATLGPSAVALQGTFTFATPTVLTLSANTITPSQNVHGVDTSGGAQNLTTINTTNVLPAFELFLYPNNASANPVTLKDGTGNLSLANGDMTLGATNSWITLMLRGSTWYEVARAPVTLPYTCNVRLTLTAGTPITVGDVTAATSVFVTPYQGNQCAFYDPTGTLWHTLTFSEITVAVPNAASQIYDLFCLNNAGAMACDTTAWTNDTTRATGLVMQSGVWVKSGDTQRRYIGSFRTTTVAGQTEDSGTCSTVPPKRYLWNYYNRVERFLCRVTSTNSYNYASVTVRQAEGSPNNQVNFIIGVAEVAFTGTVNANAQGAAGGTLYQVGLTFDATNAFDPTQIGGTFAVNAAVGDVVNVVATLRKYPAVGFHFVAWVEAANAVGNATVFSNNSASHSWSGISASIWG